MEDLLVGGAEGDGRGALVTGSGIAVEAGEGTTGDLDADAVAALEAVGRRPELHRRARRVVSVGEADQTVADVRRAPLLVDVAQADEHVGVRQAGAEEDLGAHLADDLDVLVQSGSCVGEDVEARLQLGVVHTAVLLQGPHPYAAERGGRVGRVVVVLVRSGLDR